MAMHWRIISQWKDSRGNITQFSLKRIFEKILVLFSLQICATHLTHKERFLFHPTRQLSAKTTGWKLQRPVLHVSPFLQIEENFLCWLWEQVSSFRPQVKSHQQQHSCTAPQPWWRTTLLNLHLPLARDFCMNCKLFPLTKQEFRLL